MAPGIDAPSCSAAASARSWGTTIVSSCHLKLGMGRFQFSNAQTIFGRHSLAKHGFWMELGLEIARHGENSCQDHYIWMNFYKQQNNIGIYQDSVDLTRHRWANDQGNHHHKTRLVTDHENVCSSCNRLRAVNRGAIPRENPLSKSVDLVDFISNNRDHFIEFPYFLGSDSVTFLNHI